MKTRDGSYVGTFLPLFDNHHIDGASCEINPRLRVSQKA